MAFRVITSDLSSSSAKIYFIFSAPYFSESEFNNIAKEQQIHPYSHNFSNSEEGIPLPDEDNYK